MEYIYKTLLEGETAKAHIVNPDPKGFVSYLYLSIGDRYFRTSNFVFHEEETYNNNYCWIISFSPDHQIIPLASEFLFDNCVRLIGFTTPPAASDPPLWV